MELREGLKLKTLGDFKAYLQRVNGCPFSSPCPVEELQSKVDGYKSCVECCRKYLISKECEV